MNTRAPQARLLRLVPPSTSTIDADLVAFTIMEFIDKNFSAIWRVLPATARVQIRNAIVSAVRMQGGPPMIRDLWYAVGTGVLVFIWAMQIAHGWAT